MLEHAHIWGAIDSLAKRHSMAITTFSKHVGLSPALLTDAKRFADDGRPVWPSLPTLAKILEYADISFVEFAHLCKEVPYTNPYAKPIPSTTSKELNLYSRHVHHIAPYISDGEIDDTSFILHINDHKFKPILKKGDKIIANITSNIRKGDSVIVYAHQKFYAGVVTENSAYHISIKNGRTPQNILYKHVDQTLRILWKAM